MRDDPRKILVDFSGLGGPWPARDVGERWNGFVIPYVTPEIREQIAASIVGSNGPNEAEADAMLAAEIRALPVVDGYVRVNLGLVFAEASDE